MAIYRFFNTIISQAKRQLSIVARAHQAAEKIRDTRTGTPLNFIKNTLDLIHQVILLFYPSLPWMANQTDLWDHVEQIQKRKGAQFMRH